MLKKIKNTSKTSRINFLRVFNFVIFLKLQKLAPVKINDNKVSSSWLKKVLFQPKGERSHPVLHNTQLLHNFLKSWLFSLGWEIMTNSLVFFFWSLFNLPMNTVRLILFFFTHVVKLEKAEILEKTISYIKKLQDLTGEMKAGNKTENSQLNGEKCKLYAWCKMLNAGLFTYFPYSKLNQITFYLYTKHQGVQEFSF